VQKDGSDRAADGVLTGGVLCLMAFLPYLLVNNKCIWQESVARHVAEAHKDMSDETINQQVHLQTSRSQPSDPDMSFVDLSRPSGNNEPKLQRIDGNTSSSGFKAYLNPMNTATPEEMEEEVPAGKGNTGEWKVMPGSLTPQVWILGKRLGRKQLVQRELLPPLQGVLLNRSSKTRAMEIACGDASSTVPEASNTSLRLMMV
jgi:hypothetical protein